MNSLTKIYKLNFFTILLASTIASSPLVHADELNMPAEEVSAGEVFHIKIIDSPQRGVKMQTVKKLLGEPSSRSARVGQPPISSWTYNDKIVYFENSTVLHVVAR